MDKQEVIEKIKTAQRFHETSTLKEDRYTNGYIQGLETGMMFIDQLDEPEKVIVPQFVADWVETCKKRNWNLFGLYRHATGKVESWIFDTPMKSERIELIGRAFLDGYTVEEDRYYVLSTEKRMMLVRKMDGKTITQADPFPFEELSDGEKRAHRLTEKEIKNYDPRYLAFAIPAEEVSE